MSRNDPRPPRLPRGTNHRPDYDGIEWDGRDDFAMSKPIRDALDAIGEALHRYDIHPCAECRQNILDTLEVCDELRGVAS